MDRFGEIKVNDSTELTHMITEEDMTKFVNLTGDNKPMHVDDNIKSGAIIAGSSRGIGAEIAKKLAKIGYGVVINYRTSTEEAENMLNQIKNSDGRGYIFKTDVTVADEVENMVDFARGKFGRIDVLVNNATDKMINKGFEQTIWADIQGSINANLKGVFNMCKATIPIMVKEKRVRL
jgi:3-oxoacyl-[acyl-carrier protein] reductase